MIAQVRETRGLARADQEGLRRELRRDLCGLNQFIRPHIYPPPTTHNDMELNSSARIVNSKPLGNPLPQNSFLGFWPPPKAREFKHVSFNITLGPGRLLHLKWRLQCCRRTATKAQLMVRISWTSAIFRVLFRANQIAIGNSDPWRGQNAGWYAGRNTVCGPWNKHRCDISLYLIYIVVG
jgi:hypothetical protein